MFKKAGLVKKKLKILVYGASGVGKTHFALTFPGVAMIDLEGGSELFSDRFDFNVLRTKDPSEIMKAVEWISDNADQFETLVIDPITVLWQVLMEAGQVNAENRAKRKSSKANLDNVSLTPRDWGIIKRKVNALYTRLVNMPCSVVVCGRIKDVNDRKGNEIIKVGEKVDAEKSTEYMFDIVIKMITANGKRIGIVEKDRSGKLQGKKLVNPSFTDFADILKVHSSGTKSQQQDASEVAKKAAEKLDPETKAAKGDKAKKAAPKKSGSDLLPSEQWASIEPPAEYIDLWGGKMWQLIGYQAKQHALNVLKQWDPQSSGEAWGYLLEHQMSKLPEPPAEELAF